MTKSWSFIEKQLYEISATRFKEDIPEVAFLISCMVCAAEEKIEHYFLSKNFDVHCKLTRLDRNYVYEIFRRMWEVK